MLLRKEKGIIGYIDIKKSVGTLFELFMLRYRRKSIGLSAVSQLNFGDVVGSFRRYGYFISAICQGPAAEISRLRR